MPATYDRLSASPSKTLLLTASAFVAAVLLHSWDVRRWSVPEMLGPAALALFATAAVWRGMPRVRFPILLIAAATAGVARFDASVSAPGSATEPPRWQARYEGRLAREPKLTVKGATIVMDRVFVFPDAGAFGQGYAGGRKSVDGEFALTLSRAPDAAIGDVLTWTCKVFPQEGMTAARGVPNVWHCAPRSPPTVTAQGRNGFANGLLGFKNGIRSVIYGLIPEPDASFVLGLLIGDTGGVPREVVGDFRATGTSHVLAVSGYNVSLVANFAFGLFAFCLLRRKSAAVAVAAFVTVFALLSGAGAPAVRAALMGGAAVAASLLGRRNAGWQPLLLVAAVMLALDPLAAASDVGFRLSFAAVVGMRAFGKPFAKRLGWLPESFGIRSACAETLSATVATLPIELHDFGLLPIAALPVNMLIVPLVPLATATGALTLALGALWSPLGLPFALATAAATKAMRFFAATGAALMPPMHLQTTAAESLAMAAILILLRLALRKREL